MYDAGKSAAGKEFQLFMKIKEITMAAGQPSSEFIQQEYDHYKNQSFFSEVIMQMKHISAQDPSKLDIIESQHMYVNQKGCIIDQAEIIRILLNLTQ